MRLASLTALVVLAVAGCGGSARPEPTASRGLPPALAQQWAAQASTIANTAAHGQGCRAQQLASTLRDEIIAQKGRVPARLQRPLVTGVNALADRITCTPQPVAVQSKTPKPAKPPPKPHGPGPGHDHDHGDHQGKDK
jgi:hypothetical protein